MSCSASAPARAKAPPSLSSGRRPGLRRLLRENGLSLVLLALFLASLLGQFLAGLAACNEERAAHGLAALAAADYLRGGEFLSSVFENWESEFLQMAAYVLLTVFLRQKGSPESKQIEGAEEVDAGPADAAGRRDPGAPWPVRAGSPALLWLYSNSLGLALGALFLASFSLHWAHSARHAAELAAMHGRPAPTLLEHLAGVQLWFESFQNWQSEFLSTFALVVLGIFLRQRGSPESKPVAAPHGSTGH
jgi:hypothetical protein